MDPMKLEEAKPPIQFQATDVKFEAKFPDGPDTLWSAKITAVRHGHLPKVFDKVFFVETSMDETTMVFIYGIESEEGIPSGFRSDLAESQRSFIQYLRDENASDDAVLGWTSKLFKGSAYAVIFKATAAFLSAKDSQANIGVSYFDEQGIYQMVIVAQD